MKAKQFGIVLIAMFAFTTVQAGPSVGGGGDVVILPDDSVVLADPFIDNGAPQPNNMPPLRALSPRILQVINLYNKASTYLIADFADKESDINSILTELATRNNDLRFYGVQTQEELNQFCAPGGRKIYKLPNGAQVQQVACTAGNETFIVEPLFVRLSLRDQGLLLIHERLTTLRDQYGGKNYSAIARFTSGLNLYLSLYSEQIKKKYRQLSNIEQKMLSDFFVAIEEIEKRNSEINDDSFQWAAHKNGGGRIHVAAIVDETAFVSLDSVIAKGSEIEQNTIIKNFPNNFRLPLIMRDSANISNVGITYYTDANYPQYNIVPNSNSKIILKAGASLKDVTLGNNTDGFTFGEQAEITNTTIKAGSFISGKNIQLTGVNMGSDSIKVGEAVAVANSQLYAKRLQLENNSSIELTIVGKQQMMENLTTGSNSLLKEVNLETSAATIGTSNVIEKSDLNLLRGSLNTGASVTIKGSKIGVNHLNIGTQTTIEDSVLYASVLKLGNKVEFKEAKIEYAELNASIASEEKLINNGVYASTYADYFPLGFVPKPIELSWDVAAFRCVYNDKPHTKTQPIRRDFLNSVKDGAIITATSLYQGKVAPFEQAWNYDINDMKVKVIYKNFNRANDKSLLMISGEGKFVSPDFKRETLFVNISDLAPCMQTAIAETMKGYFVSSKTSLAIPNDLASR